MEFPARIVNLPKIEDDRGNLSFVEELTHIPFRIERSYWLYDVPGGGDRDGHAFKTNDEFIIALSGSFDVVLNDGHEERHFYLNRSYFGLYVPHGLWREIRDFSTNSFAMILSSATYDANDYVRDYGEFVKLKADGRL